MQNNYHIIDEPKKTGKVQLAVNPLIILFAAILVPLFVSLPAFGKLWMPLVWIIANGYFLGSATWRKEWVICIIGFTALALIVAIMVVNTSFGIGTTNPDFVLPYLRILLNATLFMTLYFAVFTQATSFELHQYMNENKE